MRDRPEWGLRERVLLCAALRFTGSRRHEVAALAALIEAGRAATSEVKPAPTAHAQGPAKARQALDITPLCAALAAGEVRCGTGTYQLSLNRGQVASCIEEMASAVVARVRSEGLFADVLEASDCVATLMTVGKRPQFSANETVRSAAVPLPGAPLPGAMREPVCVREGSAARSLPPPEPRLTRAGAVRTLGRRPRTLPTSTA